MQLQAGLGAGRSRGAVGTGQRPGGGSLPPGSATHWLGAVARPHLLQRGTVLFRQTGVVVPTYLDGLG